MVYDVLFLILICGVSSYQKMHYLFQILFFPLRRCEVLRANFHMLYYPGSSRDMLGVRCLDDLPDDASCLIVLADPFTFPAEELLVGLREQVGVDLPVVGGMASAARGPGGNRLLLDGSILSDGAIAVGGFVYALWLKRSAPQRFAAIGELHDEELTEAFPDE